MQRSSSLRLWPTRKLWKNGRDCGRTPQIICPSSAPPISKGYGWPPDTIATESYWRPPPRGSCAIGSSLESRISTRKLSRPCASAPQNLRRVRIAALPEPEEASTNLERIFVAHGFTIRRPSQRRRLPGSRELHFVGIQIKRAINHRFHRGTARHFRIRPARQQHSRQPYRGSRGRSDSHASSSLRCQSADSRARCRGLRHRSHVVPFF